MIAENPPYLACPWCPAQSIRTDDVRMFLLGWTPHNRARMYKCPANHTFYIETEDTSFNFGHNKEDE
jgi:hypothetical protein